MGREQDLTAWRLFVTTVDSGSVNAACDRLQMDPSTASRILKALERDLGVELFNRATRPVTLSAVGRAVLGEAREMLQVQNRLLSHLQDDRQSMKGTIRIATYSGVAEQEFTPLLMKFQAIYADVDFDMTEIVEPPPKGFTSPDGKPVDVMIGYSYGGEMPGVLAFHNGDMPFVACASPQYIHRHGAPVHPEDCANHIGVIFGSAHRAPAKTVYKGKESADIHWQRTLTFHSFGAAKNALLLGAGAAIDMPFFHSCKELKSGDLVPILDGWQYPTHQCFLYVQEASMEYQRVRVFVEWMVQKERQKLQALRKEYQQLLGLSK